MFLFVLLVSLLVIGFVYFAALMVEKNKSGVNTNMIQFIEKLSTNTDKGESKTYSESLQKMYNKVNFINDEKMPRATVAPLNEEKHSKADNKFRVQGSVNATTVNNCSSISVESRLKGGALLNKSFLDKDCKFDFNLSTFRKSNALFLSTKEDTSKLPDDLNVDSKITKEWKTKLSKNGSIVEC